MFLEDILGMKFKIQEYYYRFPFGKYKKSKKKLDESIFFLGNEPNTYFTKNQRQKLWLSVNDNNPIQILELMDDRSNLKYYIEKYIVKLTMLEDDQ